MTVPVTRKRGKHSKTRTGCRTCRIRRIKCDEARPACRRCSSTGRHCLGYEMSLALLQGQSCQDRALLPQNQSLVKIQSVPRPIASFPTGMNFMVIGPHEAQAFDFFRKQTLYFLPGCATATTWETIAMQLSHSEPALTCAIVAVGSMHQARTGRPAGLVMPVYEPAQFEFAMDEYSRSVGLIQKYINENQSQSNKNSVEVVLLACLMFICFELLHGNNYLGILHLRTGLRILYEHLHGPIPENVDARRIQLKAEPRSTMDLLAEIYVRLDGDATMFGQSEPFLRASVGEMGGQNFVLSPMPKVFHSLEEARLHLDALSSARYFTKGKLLRLAEIKMQSKANTSHLDEDQVNCLLQAECRFVDLSNDPDLWDEMQALERAVAAWSSALASMPTDPKHESHQVRLLLEIQYFVVWFFVSTWRDQTETMGDRYKVQYSHILGLIEQYLEHIFDGNENYLDEPRRPGGPLRTFSLSHSVLLPLYLIASQCRDSSIRRRALMIPSRLHIQESMMDSDLLSACLGRIIDMEEENARRINGFSRHRKLTCDDVPEAARYMDVNDDGVGGRLVCCRWAHPDDDELTLEEFDFNIEDVTASLREVSCINDHDSPTEDESQLSPQQLWMQDYRFKERLTISTIRRSGEAHKRDKIKELCAYSILDTNEIYTKGELSQFSVLVGIPLLICTVRPSMLRPPKRRPIYDDGEKPMTAANKYGYKDVDRYFPNEVAGAIMAGNVDGQERWTNKVGAVLFARADKQALETSHIHVLLGLLNEATNTANTVSVDEALAMLTPESFKTYYTKNAGFFKELAKGEDWSDRTPWEDNEVHAAGILKEDDGDMEM
ncbi:hypothetical protein PRZ48_005109 [Zasmidium cellare]|uniref:Zn(2)-C6 fungal-type domain-containing protein n=1 Tax=Zasmidium cellare TaxID=395010 RepID=A0ABR0ESX6_ZASCE|nr:hypothetical protein PRZ48_005109 [Zasmidium cellare]